MSIAIIVAIGWMYVTVLMAASQPTVLAAIGTLLFYGLLPTGILMYIMTAPIRSRRRQAHEADEAERAAAAETAEAIAKARAQDSERP
jgi:type VI protein secretion system component VasK